MIRDERRSFSISPNETLILWPGVAHWGTGDYEKSLSFYWIHFRATRGNGFRSGPLNVPQHARPRRTAWITELFHRYLDDQESGNLGPEQARLLVAMMLMESSIQGPSSSLAEESLAGRAQRLIATKFDTGLHAGEVSAALNCNPDYLGRIYRKVYGRTLTRAIHDLQISEARRLLRESDKNIDEIAASCGFKESRYLRKLFRQYQGLSPKAYRGLYARAFINVR